MDDEREIIDGYDGEEENDLHEELVTKPALCLSCRKDNDPREEEMCILTRMESAEGEEFACGAYEKMA